MKMREIVRRLTALGCRVECRETTAGAWKVWLSYPGSQKDFTSKLMRAFGFRSKDKVGVWYSAPSFYGDDFTIQFQTEAMDDHRGLFVAKPRIRTRAGREYAMGIDC